MKIKTKKSYLQIKKPNKFRGIFPFSCYYSFLQILVCNKNSHSFFQPTSENAENTLTLCALGYQPSPTTKTPPPLSC